MPSKLVDEILVPAEYGRAWKVSSGQRMRVIAIDGPQVSDMAVFNAHYYKETYSSDFSYLWNCYLGTGDGNRIRYLYSRPPWCHLMLEITDDKVATNWVRIGGHCNQRSKELRGRTPILASKGTCRTCQDNLAEVIAPYGMTAEDVPHTLNFWMKIVYAPDGTFAVLDSPAQKGDYLDFLAHMDCLIELSACPTSEINAGSNKPLKMEIYE